MTDQWYYAVGKDKIGPLPESKIIELILNGQITLKDLLWKKGMPQWQKAEVIPLLVPIFNQKDASGTPPPLPVEDAPPSLLSAGNEVISKIKSFGSFFTQKASPSAPVSVPVSALVPVQPPKNPLDFITKIFGNNSKPDSLSAAIPEDSSGDESPSFVLNDGFIIPESEVRDKNKVTGEIVFDTKSLDKEVTLYNIKRGVLTLLIDEEFVGGAGDAQDGIHGEDFDTSIGRHVLKLKFTKTKQRGVFISRGTKFIQVEQVHSVYFEKPGHYKIELIATDVALDDFPPLRIVATLISKAKEKLGQSLYFKKLLVGLWEDTNNVGSSIMFTNDGALIRNDGLMAKYRWIEKYKLEVNDLYKKVSFILEVISISQYQMILSQDGQNLVLKKGKSLTEIEIEKEKELMLKQAHLRSETFKNNAIGVGTLLMSGGIAILSAGVGIGAAAAGAASSGGNSSDNSISGNDPNNGMKRCRRCNGCGKSRDIISGSYSNTEKCHMCKGAGWGYHC